MSSKPMITEKEQLDLRNKAKDKLERLQLYYDREVNDQIIAKFKLRFRICDSVYKVILVEHQIKKENPTNMLGIDMRQVPHALNFAGYSFDRPTLDALFGNSPTIKGKTVNQLYKEVINGTNKKAEDQIIYREKELFGYMDSFLSAIRTQDQKQ